MTPQLRKDINTLNRVTGEAKARRVIKRATYSRVNRRRAELIRAHIASHDTEELEELSELQDVVGRIVNLAYPPPPRDPKIEALLQRLHRQ